MELIKTMKIIDVLHQWESPMCGMKINVGNGDYQG
jgi:hypothetical protein